MKIAGVEPPVRPEELNSRPSNSSSAGVPWQQLRAILQLARPHHYGKNILVCIGALLAWTMAPTVPEISWGLPLLWAVIATCLIASANYVLNEILDANSDRNHPNKRNRVMVVGTLSCRYAIVEMLILGCSAVALSAVVNLTFTATAIVMLMMGLVYNVPPLRLKDQPVLDVLCESINSPLRLLLGWFVVAPGVFPPWPLVGLFWSAGGYFMSQKRLREYRQLNDPTIARAYRKSFSYYDEQRLVASMLVYAGGTLIMAIVLFSSYATQSFR